MTVIELPDETGSRQRSRPRAAAEGLHLQDWLGKLARELAPSPKSRKGRYSLSELTAPVRHQFSTLRRRS